MQTTDKRTAIKWLTTILSGLWMAWGIWLQFFNVDPTNFGFRSAEVEARMQECGGTFQQRYECKEAIILAKGHDSFVIWLEKVGFILGPPLLLAYVVGRVGRDKFDSDEEFTYRHSVDNRRSGRRPKFNDPPSSVAKRRVR